MGTADSLDGVETSRTNQGDNCLIVLNSCAESYTHVKARLGVLMQQTKLRRNQCQLLLEVDMLVQL